MAKNNDKRAERMARSNRNVNRAITVLMAGVIAEFYLLMVNNYYVKGGVGQVLTMMTVLQVIDYIGCALFGAGLVVWLMRKKWTRFAPAAPWLLCIGFFFAVSSILMLKVYPQGTTMMCVIVPVVMLIGIVFLLYPREFSVQAVGLTASLMAMYLIHRGSGSDTWGGIVIGCSILAICVVAVLGVAVFKAGKNDGKLKKLGDLPGEIESAAKSLEPARLTRYVMDLAAVFHTFYTACRVKVEDRALMEARLKLIDCTRIVLKNVLAMLKITAPERM